VRSCLKLCARGGVDFERTSTKFTTRFDISFRAKHSAVGMSIVTTSSPVLPPCPLTPSCLQTLYPSPMDANNLMLRSRRDKSTISSTRKERPGDSRDAEGLYIRGVATASTAEGGKDILDSSFEGTLSLICRPTLMQIHMIMILGRFRTVF
jgi:hypothetical protein